jgi:hypothetical protein
MGKHYKNTTPTPGKQTDLSPPDHKAPNGTLDKKLSGRSTKGGGLFTNGNYNSCGINN